MKILAVRHAVPSMRLTNDDVIRELGQHNSHLTAQELAQLESAVRKFLEASGSRTRFRTAPGERPTDLVRHAVRLALQDAELDPAQVDLVIFAGVVRGWIEPAMANLVQRDLGLTNATCFDVLDGCASWLRALHVTHGSLRAGPYRNALIVNCEYVPEFHDFRRFRDLEQLEYRAAIYTIGATSTATIVSSESPDDDFHFSFRNYGNYLQLCLVPLDNVGEYLEEPRLDREPLKLFSLSAELFGITIRKIREAYRADPILTGRQHDVVFGHEASEKASRLIGRMLGLPYSRYVSTHSEYGNTIAASVPLAMSLALRDGRLRRGDRALIIVGSSGITVGFASFTF